MSCQLVDFDKIKEIDAENHCKNYKEGYIC